ncbi:iron-containing redox enzyme family protein [Salsuginibacillus kocurii]|uniref:iron-containing redox enzyme family protein n=1 Tax=Salsuginibacillus kocurii TaxID=427078 RepID=UPI00035F5D71|nr:iron-containing redox enzyme family protein [Salsuginibacillus kocurii]
MNTIVEKNLEFPRLRHCTFLEGQKEDPMYMVVGKDFFELENTVGDRDKFLEVKRYFDGRHSIDQISKITGVAKDHLTDIISEFNDLGLMRTENEEEKNFIKKDDFIKQIEDSCEMWASQIGYHQLFAGLERKELRKEVFQGFLLEVYHYVKGARKHIAVALANCSTDREQELLTEFFVDEYDHGKLLIEAVEKTGIPKDQTINAHPIIGTMSLINMLSEIGRQSTFAYIACTSLFEARAEDFEASKASFERLAEYSGFDKTVVDPVIEHMRGDIEADHNSLLEEVLEGIDYISAEEAHFTVNCLHDLKHSFDQFHDQIIEYYSDVSNYIPRLKVDYFSL